MYECMCVCVYVCMYVCMYQPSDADVIQDGRKCREIYALEVASTRYLTYICTHACMRVCVCVCARARARARYTCMHIHA